MRKVIAWVVIVLSVAAFYVGLACAFSASFMGALVGLGIMAGGLLGVVLWGAVFVWAINTVSNSDEDSDDEVF